MHNTCLSLSFSLYVRVCLVCVCVCVCVCVSVCVGVCLWMRAYGMCECVLYMCGLSVCKLLASAGELHFLLKAGGSSIHKTDWHMMLLQISSFPLKMCSKIHMLIGNMDALGARRERERERERERDYSLSCNANLWLPSLCCRLIVQKPSKRATQKTYSHLEPDGLRENYGSPATPWMYSCWTGFIWKL